MFSFPKEPAVEEIVRRSVTAMPGQVRISNRGVVLHQDWSQSTLFLMPASAKEIIHALLRQAGLEAEPSNPGQYAEQIIRKMGTLHGDCRVFKIRGVRDVLDRLGNGSHLSRGNIHDLVMSETPDEYGRNWRPDLYDDLYLREGQHRPLSFTTIFDVLLEARLLRPGFVFRCPTCFKDDWYHVSEFDEQYTCRFCFTPQRVDFGSKHEWLFKADGLFRIPDSALGSVAVILSLWRLQHLTIFSGRYVTSRNLLAKDTGNRYEIDYAFLAMSDFDTSYDLVLGQATRFGDFKDEDMRKMAELASRFQRKPYLAFSTLRDRFSNDDKKRLGDLVARGFRVIALTREELDPYDLHARFAGLPRRYRAKMGDLAENTDQLNIAPKS